MTYDIEARVAEEAAQMRRFLETYGLSEVSLDALIAGAHAGADAANTAAIQASGWKPACRAGCAFCCHTLVTVTPAEALYIARRLGAREDAEALFARVAETDAKSRGKTGAERYAGHIPCAFLDRKTKLCGIHEVRPLTCRAMHSASRSRCESSFRKRDPYKSSPTLKAFFDTSHTFSKALGRALPQADARQLDLPAALAVIRATPDCFVRWAQGEDVFATALAPM